MNMKILVPVDPSNTTDRTLAALIAMKEEFPARFPGPLTLLHVVNLERLAFRMIPDFQVDMVREPARKAAEALLKGAQARLAAAGLESTVRLEFGNPREVICRIANEEGFGQLIIGRRGLGEIRDVLFGSVTNFVLHNVRCPVLLF